MRFYLTTMSIYALIVTIIMGLLIGQNRQLKINSNYNEKTLKLVDLNDVNMQDIPLLGNENAGIVVIGYFDFECPVCAVGSQNLHRLLDEFPTKVKIGFKNMPLLENSSNAACAGLAAFRQGRFWEMEKVLFEKQESLNDDLYDQIAKDLGLDLETFQKTRKPEHWQEYLELQKEEAENFSIDGHAIMINGVWLKGASYETLAKAVRHFSN